MVLAAHVGHVRTTLKVGKFRSYLYATVLVKRDHFVGVANFAFLHDSIAFQMHYNVNPLVLSSQVPFWCYI